MAGIVHFGGALAVALILSACGGGGGGSGDGAVSPSGAITFSPTQAVATYDQGDSVDISLMATVNTNIGGALYVKVIDTAGVITPTINLTTTSLTTATVTLHTSNTLAAGSYSGSLQVRLCANAACSTEYSGSPVALPYAIKVLAPNTKDLPTATGLPDWETYQANPKHTGYVGFSPLASTITKRWRTTIPVTTYPGLSSATIGQGKVFLTNSGSTISIHALNEADGSSDWVNNLGMLYAMSPPSVSGGNVYAASSGHSDTFMWSFDAATGTKRFKTAFGSQWEHYLAPVVANGKVYNGSARIVDVFNATTGTALTNFSRTSYLAQSDLWSPTLIGNYVYAVFSPYFAGFDSSDGKLAFQIAETAYSTDWGSLNSAPVASGNASLLAISSGIFTYASPNKNRLSRYNISNPAVPTETWSVDGKFISNPVIADGSSTFYVVNRETNALEARDELTGALLWSWKPGALETLPVGANLVLTNNLLFLTSDKATYAIDLATHQSVWNYSGTGQLAISANKVLYLVSSSKGRVDAFNLY